MRNFSTSMLSVLMLALGVASVSPALAQSWKINSGRNVGALSPMGSRKLPDGSTYLTGGSKVFVETEDATYPITGQSMDCRWICRIPANGKDGLCSTLCGGVDKDGDLFSFRSMGFAAGNYEVSYAPVNTRKPLAVEHSRRWRQMTLLFPLLDGKGRCNSNRQRV